MGNSWRWLIIGGVIILAGVTATVLVKNQKNLLPQPTPVVSPTPALSPSPSATPAASARAKSGCFITGCNGEICSNRKDMVSICIFKEEYACYKQAVCEQQANGQCGWTQTPQYQSCLKSLPKGGTEVGVY